MPLFAGREILPQDTLDSAKVVVVNQAFARFYFKDQDPLGRRISDLDDGKNPMTIVGVVGTAKENTLREPAARRIYTPYLQQRTDDPDPASGLRYEIRTLANVGLMEAQVRQALHKVDANLRDPTIEWSQTLIEDELELERLIAKLSGFFSLIALLLASIGLYGVMSYLTARRTTEVGLRMALGASRSSVISLVFREAFTMAAVGLVVGMACAFGVGRLTANTLYGVNAFDPLTIAVSSLVICLAALLASWIPAQRASRVDPMVALRSE